MTADEFKEQVFVFKDRMYRFAKSLLMDDTEAQDVTQDVLMKLWDIRDALHKYKSIEALTMTSIRNRCMDKARRKNVTFSKESDLKYQAEKSDNANPTENKELGEIIRQAIENLTEPQRTIIHLRDVEELEFEEIEPIVGMNIETLRVNLSRARKKVREEIKKVMSYGIA